MHTALNFQTTFPESSMPATCPCMLILFSKTGNQNTEVLIYRYENTFPHLHQSFLSWTSFTIFLLHWSRKLNKSFSSSPAISIHLKHNKPFSLFWGRLGCNRDLPPKHTFCTIQHITILLSCHSILGFPWGWGGDISLTPLTSQHHIFPTQQRLARQVSKWRSLRAGNRSTMQYWWP